MCAAAMHHRTYAMYLFEFFFINLRSCDDSVFALSILSMECRLMGGGI